jgi:hypothetical protein
LALYAVTVKQLIRAAAFLAASCSVAGCYWDSHAQVLAHGDDTSATRSMQSRIFPTGDQPRALRAVADTVRGMGFTIDTSDAALGVVSGTSEGNPDVHITVTIQPAGAGQTLVRASGNRFLEAVSEPAAYQTFFSNLEQTMSLQATR